MSEATFATDPPAYMQPGSIGPAVNLVLKFLIAWASQNHSGVDTGIKCDGKYGKVSGPWMERFQASHGLDRDRGCGPKTREKMKGHGFDFVAEAKRTGCELTMFVQPDGAQLFWGPGIEPQEDRELALVLLHKAFGH